MIQSIVLDGLIVLIILMIAAIGYSRGGLRELCTAAGLLFGSRLADAWAPRWGNWVAERFDIAQGSGAFIVYVVILTIATLVCGYGAALAFFSRPGPAGRLYGTALGLVNGIVLTSFVLDAVRRYLRNGSLPAVVADSHIAKAMVDGFGWILLGIAAFIVVATAFGFLIRENEPEESLATYAPPRQAGPTPARVTPERPTAEPRTATQAPVPDKLEPARTEPAATQETAALRVREVRHWEEPVEPNPRTAFGAGWSQTWPVASPGSEVKTPWELEDERRRLRQASPGQAGSTRSPASQPAPRSDADALRDWLAEERKNDPSAQ